MIWIYTNIACGMLLAKMVRPHHEDEQAFSEMAMDYEYLAILPLGKKSFIEKTACSVSL